MGAAWVQINYWPLNRDKRVPAEQLTTAKLKSINDQHVGTILNDGGGLRGRVRRNRSGVINVQFEYKYRLGSKYRTAKVEQWPRKTLAEIRVIFRQMKLDHSNGIDPVDKRITEKLESKLDQARQAKDHQQELDRLAAEAASQRTLSTALEYWEKMELSRRKDRGSEAMRAIRKDVLPTLGDVALGDICRSMLLDVLDGVVNRGSRVMANHLFSDLRQFFNFAVARDWVDNHPLAGLKKENIGGRQKERDRFLTEDEIRELRKKLPSANLQRTTEAAIWIMLSTCCRVGELIQATWNDVDFNTGEWFIPAGNSKNAKDHTVFLSPFATAQFSKLHALTGGSEWCLPNRADDGHMGLKSITKQIKDRIRSEPLENRTTACSTLLLSGGSWTPHDLRRTGATMMGELGAMGEVIERCLNHIEGNKLRRVYQRHELRAEQREAWMRLGERLELLLNHTEKVLLGKFG